MKRHFYFWLLILAIVACGGNSQSDWVGTWENRDCPGVTWDFFESGSLWIGAINHDTSCIWKAANYTVDNNTYVISFFDNEFTRNGDFAGVVDTGEWIISDGRLTLYLDYGGAPLNLNRMD